MEKELIINGIKYVKYEEYKEYKIYDLVNYNGYEWIVIDVEDNKLTLMMKNCFPKEKMKAIFKEEYLTEDGGIKYSLNKTCNDWNKTEIKRGLNNEFLEEFNKDELIKMKTNYDTDKYSYDYIRIPKIREIKNLILIELNQILCAGQCSLRTFLRLAAMLVSGWSTWPAFLQTGTFIAVLVFAQL